MSRLARLGAIILGVFAVLIVGAILVLKSGLPAYVAERYATAALGREVTIGDIDISLWPPGRVVVSDLKVANMETGTTANMVKIARAEAVVDISALLTGRLDVLLLTVDQPEIVAEKDQWERANWQFGDPEKPATEAAPDFPVRKLIVNDGHVTYRDPTQKIDVVIAVDSEPGGDGGTDRLRLDGKGRYAGSEFRLAGRADTVLNLQDKEQPYALELEASAGETRARFAGTLKEPLRAEGLAGELHLEAHDAYDLYQLTGIAIPPTPPYKVDGELFRDGAVWRLEPFTAQVGNSDLQGKLRFDTGAERPKLEAELTSKRLRLGDFVGFVGGEVAEKSESGVEQVQRKTEEKQRAGEPTRPPPKSDSPGVIPDTEIDFERLKAMDAAIKFRGTRVESPIVPISEVATELALDNGLLQVKPLRFAIGQGKLDFTLTLNGRQKPATFETVMSVNRVPLGEILKSVERTLQQHQTSTGTIGGRAEVRGAGNSLKGLLASSNGHLGLAMEQGQIGSLLIELIGIDAAESIGVIASGNKPVPLRCLIMDFEFIDGTMGSRTLIIDTTDTNIIGEGSIDFETEKIHFRIVPHPKDVSIFSARSPILITGTLADMTVRPETGPIAARVGLAAALSALLTPLAAPLAFLDVGLGKDSDCAAFVQDVRGRIAKQKREAPPSGSPESAAPAPPPR